jgi:hypothetical protein
MANLNWSRVLFIVCSAVAFSSCRVSLGSRMERPHSAAQQSACMLNHSCSLTVEWDALAAYPGGLTGYRLHYGVSPGVYTTVLNVGQQTSYAITGLGSEPIYFAVSAYGPSGESAPSEEQVATADSGCL